MKKAIKKLCLIMAAIMCLAILPCQVNAEDAAKPKIFVIGDSMAASYEEAKYPRMGWGQALSSFFTDEVEVVNCALAGESSRSFYYDHWKSGVEGSVLDQIGEGDYLLFTFGANDDKDDKTTTGEDGNISVASYRKTNPALGSDVEIPAENGATPADNTTYSFKAFMKAYITETIGKGATPIMLTQPERGDNRSPSNYQFAVQTMAEYTTAITELADELNEDESIAGKFLCLKDITPNTLALYREYGETNYKKLFSCFAAGKYNTTYWGENAVADTTHFRDFGAAEVAGIIVEELIKNNSDLTQYLRTVTKPVIYDSDHNVVGTGFTATGIQGKGVTLYPRAQFINKEGTETTLQVITARYDNDGALQQVISNEEVSVPAQSVVSFDTSFTMPSETAPGQIKMFTWKDYDTLVPHANNLQKWSFTEHATKDDIDLVFDTTFDDYALDSSATTAGWTINAGNATIQAFGGDGSNSLYIPDNTGVKDVIISPTFTNPITVGDNAEANMATVLECDMMLGNGMRITLCDGTNSILELKNGSGKLTNIAYEFGTTTTDDTVVATGITGKEVHLKAVVNEKNRTADIYIDGVKGNEEPLNIYGGHTNYISKYTTIDCVVLKAGSASGDATYIDNLAVYRQEQEGAPEEEPEEEKQTTFGEDFDNDNYALDSSAAVAGWTIDTGSATIKAFGGDGSKSLYIPNNTGVKDMIISPAFATPITIGDNAEANMATVLECDMILGKNMRITLCNGTTSILELKNGSGTLTNIAYEFGTTTKENTAVAEGINGKEVHLKVVINEKERTADIYVDGVKGNEEPLNIYGGHTNYISKYTTIDCVVLKAAATSGGETYIDNLEVYRQPISAE